MSTIKTIIRIDKKNKNNECPIVFRFIKNRRATYIASNIIIPIDKWDPEKGAIKRSHPMHRQLNAELKIKVHELNTKYTQLKVNKPKANKINIKKELEKSTYTGLQKYGSNFNQLFNQRMQQYAKSPATVLQPLPAQVAAAPPPHSAA